MNHAKWLCTLIAVEAALSLMGGTGEVLAGIVLDYQASSGLFPDQLATPYTLVDTASPETPTLAGGILTLSTSANAENMGYNMTGPTISTSAPFFIEARVRLLSGSSTGARAPIMISFTTAPNVGSALAIGSDSVFFNTSNTAAGPTANVDTNDAFHTYRIEYNGAGLLTLLYDGTPLLSGATFVSSEFNGPTERILWGETSLLATGTSQWEFFRHNALVEAVPEPATLTLWSLGALGCIAGASRRRSPA